MADNLNSPETLFTRIGGMDFVNATVDIFYARVIRDPRINSFFEHIDMEKQAGKLKAFLAFAFGAPYPYPGQALREAHQYMEIREEHFDAVADHLEATLLEVRLAPALIDEVMSVILATKEDVLNA